MKSSIIYISLVTGQSRREQSTAQHSRAQLRSAQIALSHFTYLNHLGSTSTQVAVASVFEDSPPKGLYQGREGSVWSEPVMMHLRPRASWTRALSTTVQSVGTSWWNCRSSRAVTPDLLGSDGKPQ